MKKLIDNVNKCRFQASMIKQLSPVGSKSLLLLCVYVCVCVRVCVCVMFLCEVIFRKTLMIHGFVSLLVLIFFKLQRATVLTVG